MTTEHSTYTYESGAQETVALSRGPITPHGHACLQISYSDGRRADCYVNTGWLRDRLDDLGEPRPRPLTPDAITDEVVERALRSWRTRPGGARVPDTVRDMLTAALTEPPARPEGAELVGALLFDMGVDEKRDEVADYIAAHLNVSPKED